MSSVAPLEAELKKPVKLHRGHRHGGGGDEHGESEKVVDEVAVGQIGVQLKVRHFGPLHGLDLALPRRYNLDIEDRWGFGLWRLFIREDRRREMKDLATGERKPCALIHRK